LEPGWAELFAEEPPESAPLGVTIG